MAYVHEDDRDRLVQAVASALATNTDYVVEFRFRHASGEWRWMDVRGRAVYDSAGQPETIYGIGIDITERKRAEESLAAARDAAESANRIKDQFMATLSHELRTPLNAILGYARMLRTNALPPEKRQRAVEIIERNAIVQNQLVEDLLDVSRIGTGKVRLDVEPIAIAAPLREAIESMRPAAEAKRITLARRCGGARDGPRRRRTAAAGVLELAVECRQVHPRGRSRDRRADRGRRIGSCLGARHRRGHLARFPAVRLRAVPAGRRALLEGTWRTRSRPRHLQAAGAAAWRDDHGHQRGSGPRCHLPRAPAPDDGHRGTGGCRRPRSRHPVRRRPGNGARRPTRAARRSRCAHRRRRGRHQGAVPAGTRERRSGGAGGGQRAGSHARVRRADTACTGDRSRPAARRRVRTAPPGPRATRRTRRPSHRHLGHRVRTSERSQRRRSRRGSMHTSRSPLRQTISWRQSGPRRDRGAEGRG